MAHHRFIFNASDTATVNNARFHFRSLLQKISQRIRRCKTGWRIK